MEGRELCGQHTLFGVSTKVSIHCTGASSIVLPLVSPPCHLAGKDSGAIAGGLAHLSPKTPAEMSRSGGCF